MISPNKYWLGYARNYKDTDRTRQEKTSKTHNKWGFPNLCLQIAAFDAAFRESSPAKLAL
jgi:hypothetical protein